MYIDVFQQKHRNKNMFFTSCCLLEARGHTFSGKTLVRRPVVDSEGSSDELERGKFVVGGSMTGHVGPSCKVPPMRNTALIRGY